MNIINQIMLNIISIIFFALVFNMVRIKKLDLRYALMWILASLSLIILTIFSSLLKFLSLVLYIEKDMISVFFIVICFLIIIVFKLTLSISKNENRVKTLVQEIGLLKLKIETLEKQEIKKSIK